MNLHAVEINQSGLPRPMAENMDKMRSITPNSLTSEESAPSRFSSPSISKPAKVIAEKMQEKKKKRKKKKWKRPKDKPSRPLSAYNLFFRSERALMLGDDAPTPEQESLKKRVHCKTHGKIGFAEMARMIGGKWKSLEPSKKKVFEDQAKILKDRYASELAVWKEAQKKGTDAANKGLDAMAAAAMASQPMGSDESCSSPLSEKAVDPLRFMVAGGRDPRNMLQQQGPYIRALQDRRMDHAALLGQLSNLDSSLLKYPSAAEASANAILHHFQQGLPQHQSPPSPTQTSQSPNFFEVDRLSQLAAMRRIQQGFGPNSFNLRM